MKSKKIIRYIQKELDESKRKERKLFRGDGFYEELGWLYTGQIMALKKILDKLRE